MGWLVCLKHRGPSSKVINTYYTFIYAYVNTWKPALRFSSGPQPLSEKALFFLACGLFGILEYSSASALFSANKVSTIWMTCSVWFGLGVLAQLVSLFAWLSG